MDVDTWKQHYDRPAWVRRHRDEIAAETGLEPPRNLAELDSWLDDYKGTVTRKLNNTDDEEHSQPDNDGGDA